MWECLLPPTDTEMHWRLYYFLDSAKVQRKLQARFGSVAVDTTPYLFCLTAFSPRGNITNQEMDEDTKFQMSLISDKDRELESLRSEVGLSRHRSASMGTFGDDAV